MPVTRILLFTGLLSLASTASAESYRHNLTIDLESEVFAVRGDAVVTQADFDARLEDVPEADRLGVLGDPENIETMLNDMLLVRLLADEGIKAGLHEDDLVQALVWRAAVNVIAERQAQHILDEGELDDYTQQARELWLTGTYRPKAPESFDFTHLLISVRSRSEAEAARLVLDLHDQLEQGATFEDLIEAHSDDPQAVDNGGSFKQVGTDELEQGFAAALMELESAGQYSEPVRSRYGWHIIRLDQRHPQRELEYEEALPKLRDVARKRHRENIRDRYYASLTGAPRELESGAVRRLLERYGLNQALTGEE